jgi:predicted Rdx family selenoprotein
LQARGYDSIETPGQKSQFDVVADGRLVFSKQQEGRFPDEGEIFDALSEQA